MQRSKIQTIILYICGLLSLSIDMLVIVDTIRFVLEADYGSTVPMMLAVSLFGFPIFGILLLGVIRNTQKNSFERKGFVTIVLFPYIVAFAFFLKDLL